MMAVMAAGFVTVFSGCSDDGESGTEEEQEACPQAPSPGTACTATTNCGYGSESCCFETHPATECACVNEQWTCYVTDACAVVAYQGYCACPEDSECTDPAPGAPNYECEDGSTGGPVCEQTGAETCGWMIRVCPEEM